MQHCMLEQLLGLLGLFVKQEVVDGKHIWQRHGVLEVYVII